MRLRKEKKKYFVDIPHYLYQHLSGLELVVYMVIRVHNPKPACNKAKLFRKYGINPASGRKALAKLMDTPVPRELDPSKIYITKCTAKERYEGIQQKIVTREACTAAEPMLINLGERYEFPHDYQQDAEYAKAKVYYKRWHREALEIVTRRRTERGISWPCIKLYFVVHSYMSFGANANGACYACHATIAKRAGLSPWSRDKVCRNLRKLVKAKMLFQGYTGNMSGKVTAVYCPNEMLRVRAIKMGLITSTAKKSKLEPEDKELVDQLKAYLRELDHGQRAALKISPAERHARAGDASMDKAA